MDDQCEDREVRKPRYETDSRGVFGIRRIGLVPLVEGNSGEGGCSSTSSVTLVKTATSTIVVDSGNPEVSDQIKENLGKVGLPLEKVNVLVTTKTDPDHTGNDSLFTHALQHVTLEDWSYVGGGTGRRVAIDTPYHWIDKYVKIVRTPFSGKGSMVILFHVPEVTHILEPETRDLAGKIIGIVGGVIDSEEDKEVVEVVDAISKMDEKDIHRPADISSIKDLVLYCDYIIPGHGPMFSTRKGDKC